jgi:starch phosphorylase
MELDLDTKADMLTAKVKHYLITTMGRSVDDATSDELYQALGYTLREEIMINWLSGNRTIEKKDVRQVYYLSLEYLPGRITTNNLTNLNTTDLVKAVMNKLNRSFPEIISREIDPGLGNGGLGRLASCFLDSLATEHYPALAYGLRYQYGIFEQQIWNGQQIEAPDNWLTNANPWEFRRDLRRVRVKYAGTTTPARNIHGDEVLNLTDYEEVWALPYDIPIIGYRSNPYFNVVTLRLWSTKESPRNFQLQRYNAGQLDQAAENTTLTDVLYPSDNNELGKRIRLKQEYLLVSASLQDIIRRYLNNHSNFRAFADKVRIQTNDTHPVLAIPELVRILTKYYDIPWKLAIDMTQQVISYTNHTILGEALEQWDKNLFAYLLPRQLQIIERMNLDFCNNVRNKYPDDNDRIRRMSIIENNRVRMANLAIVGSHKVNGVAKLHTEILKSTVFKDFYDMYPDKFINITNGVTQRRWLLECNPELSKFITKRIGDGWITDFPQIKNLAQYASDPESQEEFLSIKRRNKHRLVDFLYAENKLRGDYGKIIEPCPLIDENSLFDVQIKRIHEYKRQLMNALQIIMAYFEILENPGKPDRVKRTKIIAGKAAPSYETAKDIIRLFYALERKINRDPIASQYLRVVFVENYNVSKAEMIIPAAELSEQISTAGTEASGTGNMKMAMNGALTIGTDDGANIEMREQVTDRWWPFLFGASANEISRLKHENRYNPGDIYRSDPQIKRALDALRDRTFASNDSEHQSFSDLFHKLVEGHYGGAPDRYFMLLDLRAYYDTQLRVDELYRDQTRWAEYAIHNVAGMGQFSTDVSVENYCRLIWDIQPCKIDQEIMARVESEYREHDRCRIY